MNNDLTLASFSSADRKWLAGLLNDMDVRRFLPYLTTDVDQFIHHMEQAEQRGLGKFLTIRLGGVGIGFVCIYDLTENPFVFYAMLPPYRNKGYMKTAVKLIENLGLPPLYTQIDKENTASACVCEDSSITVRQGDPTAG